MVTELLPRLEDSARYQVTWTPAEDAQNVGHYLVQPMQGSVPLERREVPAPRTTDTLSLALPAVGDSLGPLLIQVQGGGPLG